MDGQYIAVRSSQMEIDFGISADRWQVHDFLRLQKTLPFAFPIIENKSTGAPAVQG
jgi:hypothetical protein